MIKKMIRLNLDDLALQCGILAGTFVLTQLITACLLLFAGVRSSLQLSGVILPLASGLLLLIFTTVYTSFSFEECIRFSHTRRSALAGLLGLSLFQAAVAMGLSALLTLLEQWFTPTLWTALSGASGYELWIGGYAAGSYGTESTFLLSIDRISLPWWAVLLIALGCVLEGVFFGAFVQRFGRKGFWILWGAWMVFIFGQSVIHWDDLFHSVWFLPVLIALVVLTFLWSVWSLLRAAVRQ